VQRSAPKFPRGPDQTLGEKLPQNGRTDGTESDDPSGENVRDAITWSLSGILIRQQKSAQKNWNLVQRNAPKFLRGPDQDIGEKLPQNGRTDGTESDDPERMCATRSRGRLAGF
jgi:hypothetical protein